MSRCPHCDRELPGFQTLCDDCYEKRRVEIEKPRSLIQTLQHFVANPLAITDQDVMDIRRMPAWFVVCCSCGGLLLCWFGGWVKANGQYAPISDVVLHGTLLCFVISLVLSLAVARRNLHVYWKAASQAFFLWSMGISGNFWIGSHGLRILKW